MSNFHIRDISTGLMHNVVLGTEINKNNEKCGILSWGNGKDNCLGHSNSDNQFFPKKIEFFFNKPVKSAICGYSHTITLLGY